MMPYAERVRLPAGGLEMINEGIRVETYLRKHRKKFLISGIGIIILRIAVLLCWLGVGQVIQNHVTLTNFVAAGSLAEIVSASFLIAMGCKPQRWLTGRILALSVFCSMGNISAGLTAIYFLLRYSIEMNILFAFLLMILHTSLSIIFLSTACYAGYALRCTVCCSSTENDNENPYYTQEFNERWSLGMQNLQAIPNPFTNSDPDTAMHY